METEIFKDCAKQAVNLMLQDGSDLQNLYLHMAPVLRTQYLRNSYACFCVRDKARDKRGCPFDLLAKELPSAEEYHQYQGIFLEIIRETSVGVAA